MSTRADVPRVYVMPVVRELLPQWASDRPAGPEPAEHAARVPGEEGNR